MIGIIIIGIILGIIIGLVFFTLGYRTVGAGERGVLLTWGAANADQTEPLSPGLHVVTPFVQSIANVNVQTQVETQTAAAASSDLQDVSTTVAVNYHVDPTKVITLYKTLGENFTNKVISPAIQESVKQVSAKYSASDLVIKRALVKDEIEKVIKARLVPYNIIVEAVSITDFKFSPTFTQAIEQKVTAVQQAEQATNQLQTVKIQAQQAAAQSNGTALSIAIIEKQLDKSPKYLEYLKVTRWNGILPQVIGTGANPLITLPPSPTNNTVAKTK